MNKQDIDYRIDRGDKGKKPVFAYISLSDCPDFLGKLEDCAELYRSVAVWPKVVLGSYRGVVIVLEAKRI